MNKEAKYETLLSGLVVAKSLGAAEIEVRADFQMVVNQVQGKFIVKSEKLKKHLALVVEAEHPHFKYFQIQQVLREENQKADKLARAASGQEDSPLPEQTVIRTFEVPAIGIKVMEIQQGAPACAGDILKYLDANEVPEDMQEARKIRNRAAFYTLIEGVLYHRGHSTPLLRCISPEETQYVLVEIHERIYGSHSEGKVLVGKVLRARYYWPRALRDAKEYVRKCRKCQEYAKVPHYLLEELTSITLSWPFAQWELT